MTYRDPRTLSTGDHNTVIALSTTEVAKLYVDDTRSEIGSEATKMKFANDINDLVVGFRRLTIDEDLDADMLVMERLYPMDFRAFEFERRQLWLDVFETELHQLHKAGFLHRDIRRPSEMPGYVYDNVFLTETGLRLIDVGISVLRHQVPASLFNRFVERELLELELFGKEFLTR